MTEENLYTIALSMVPNIGAVQAKLILEHFGSATTVFKTKKKDLAAIEGIGTVRANAIKEFEDFKIAEDEIVFCDKHRIQILPIHLPNYPKKLLNCYDAPTVLYYRGTDCLNHAKTISIIGTRTNTEYGRKITETIVEELKDQGVLIVSGLAFGIDAIAHKAAIKNNLPTIGVLAHGLDTIYPNQHKGLAKEMLQNGGLLTEYGNNTIADKHNFPRRNRIVAGMTDATIVIETAAKGGSMITAELAYNYNRDLFALPGKVTDIKSAGCLKLIQQNKAIIFTTTEQLITELGWNNNTKKTIKQQRELFVDLTDDEKVLVKILEEKNTLHIDEIFLKSGLSSSTIAGAILNLELNNIINSLPGKMYALI